MVWPSSMKKPVTLNASKFRRGQCELQAAAPVAWLRHSHCLHTKWGEERREEVELGKANVKPPWGHFGRCIILCGLCPCGLGCGGVWCAGRHPISLLGASTELGTKQQCSCLLKGRDWVDSAHLFTFEQVQEETWPIRAKCAGCCLQGQKPNCSRRLLQALNSLSQCTVVCTEACRLAVFDREECEKVPPGQGCKARCTCSPTAHSLHLGVVCPGVQTSRRPST